MDVGVLEEGQTLGRYELLAPMGKGGMGTVWAARLRGTHGFSKIVAIKTLLPAVSADPRFEVMFLAEAEIASRITHPNVCQILDQGEERDTLYLVMEAIDGDSLAVLAKTCREKERPIPDAVAARIIAQAARGLHAAHTLETETGELSAVIHRDVSPQNVLVTCEGLVKIVDFGIARPAAREDHTTEANVIKGKVSYLAPEQIENRTLDVRVDVFALGIVLYELVTGTHPFTAETDLGTILAIASPDRAPSLTEVDARLAAIAERALEKEPDKRFSSMRELAIALERFASEIDSGVDETAVFVNGLLGVRRADRRQALREAANRADERRIDEEAAPAVDPPGERPRGRALAIVGTVLLSGIGIGAVGMNARREAPVVETHILAPPSAAPAPTASPSAPPAVAVSVASEPSVVVAPKPRIAPLPKPSASARRTTRGPLDGWD